MSQEKSLYLSMHKKEAAKDALGFAREAIGRTKDDLNRGGIGLSDVYPAAQVAVTKATFFRAVEELKEYYKFSEEQRRAGAGK